MRLSSLAAVGKFRTTGIPFLLQSGNGGGGEMAVLPDERDYWGKLLKLVSRYTRGHGDAEDLLHTAYIRMEQYRSDHVIENPSAFLVRTATNIAVDIHRHEKFWEPHDDRQEGLCPDDAPLNELSLQNYDLGLNVRWVVTCHLSILVDGDIALSPVLNLTSSAHVGALVATGENPGLRRSHSCPPQNSKAA